MEDAGTIPKDDRSFHNNNALTRLMDAAKNPAAFAFTVNYAPANTRKQKENRNDTDEDDDPHDAETLLKQWNYGDTYLYDAPVEKAMGEIHHEVFQEFDKQCLTEFYPMYCLDDKKSYNMKKLKEDSKNNERASVDSSNEDKSTDATVSEPGTMVETKIDPTENNSSTPFYPLFRVAETQRCQKFHVSAKTNVTMSNVTAKSKTSTISSKANPALSSPQTMPSEGSYVTAITACFGSRKLKRKKMYELYEPDENEVAQCASGNNESCHGSKEDFDDDKNDDTDDDEVEGWDLVTLDEEDVHSYWTKEEDYFYSSDKRKKRPYLPILGFILTYSDGLEIEVGSLRGTTCHSTLKLFKDERIFGLEQHTCLEGGNARPKDYPISVGIKTSSGRYVYFEQGSLKGDIGGGRFSSYGREKDKIPENDNPNALLLEWNYEQNRIKCYTRSKKSCKESPKERKERNAVTGSGVPLTSGEKMIQSIQLTLQTIKDEAKEFEKCKKGMASTLRDMYSESLWCICNDALRELITWFLAQNGRCEKLKCLDRQACSSPLSLDTVENIFSNSGKKARRLGYEESNRISRERQRAMSIQSDRELKDLLAKKEKILKGVQYHLRTLSAKFEKDLQCIEDKVLQEEGEFRARVLAQELLLKGEVDSQHDNKIFLCQKGCHALISDPGVIRKGKRCSIPGCFDQNTNCGCTIKECRLCFAPMCPDHMTSHEKQCSSTFTQRCGWKNGLPSLRFQDKFCGSILEDNEDQQQCLSCGVQCCANCGIFCAGYQPRMFCIPSLGYPPKKQRFAFQPCAAFCCLTCQEKPHGLFGMEGQCPKCNGKKYALRDNDVTGYSEPSDMDSDFGDADCSSSSSSDQYEADTSDDELAPNEAL